MEVFFRNKEESNKLQQEEFLALLPVDRFYSFLGLIHRLKDFPTNSDALKRKEEKNFVVKINADR